MYADDGRTPRLYEKAKSSKWPIVYSEAYNIGFLGLEKVHPFDSGKWGKIFEFLKGTLYARKGGREVEGKRMSGGEGERWRGRARERERNR